MFWNVEEALLTFFRVMKGARVGSRSPEDTRRKAQENRPGLYEASRAVRRRGDRLRERAGIDFFGFGRGLFAEVPEIAIRDLSLDAVDELRVDLPQRRVPPLGGHVIRGWAASF